MTNHLRTKFFVTLAAAALAVGACKKEGGGVSGESATILNYLPKDSALLVGVSWSKLRSSPLFEKLKDRQSSAGNAMLSSVELEMVKATCGIDVVSDVKAMVVATGPDYDESRAFVAITGDFDKTSVETCFDKLELREGEKVNLGNDSVYSYWPKDDTLLLSTVHDAKAMKEAVADGSVKENTKLMKLLDNVDSSSTVWGAGLVEGKAAGMLGVLGATGGYISIHVTSGLKATLGVVFKNADKASAASTMLEAQLQQLKGQAGPFKDLMEGVESDSEGDTVVVKATLSKEQLESLEQLGQSFAL